MARQGLTRSSLSRKSGVDPNTVSDFLNGLRWPILKTLAKIEAALGLTPGTLAALGEDPHLGEADPPNGTVTTPTLRSATDEELLAELGYRMVQLRRAAEDATASGPASMQERRHRQVLEQGQLVDRAADSNPSEGTALRAQFDEHDHHQDPDGPEFGA
ncbi:MAG: helix-turn-helix transcriptional regulator [Propioniciclava sp.]|uniref:helix-turn-helix domain-containing protein n=1 Tax=Propioniciclava sp. TaxID=2038686 RepID=UPI0039E38357